jgi:heavy metal sensor kinase
LQIADWQSAICNLQSPICNSLRFRLTAWNTLVVLLVVIVTLVGVREGVRRTLLAEFDELLLEDVQEIELDLKQAHAPRPGSRQSAAAAERLHAALNHKAQGHVHHRWFVQFLDADGRLVWASDNSPSLDLAVPTGSGSEWQTVAPYRLVQSRYEEAGRPPLVIRVGASQEHVHNAVSLLTRIMVLAGGLILLVAPLGGYWLAGRATRPLARIIATTERLQPARLEERLPVRRTGDELDRLSQTINGMLDRIASYLEQNRDFIANAAHELRSPLAAVRSSVEVALNCQRAPEEYAELLAEVLEQCSGLQTLVNRLLVLAEGDAGRLALRAGPGRLDQVVLKAVAMFEGVAESCGVSLAAAAPVAVPVPADEFYLREVVNNLIDNAIKFTPAGGRVVVEVGAAKGLAVLTVTDTGVGIPPEDVPRIFERFYRGNKSRSADAGRRGSGLGLSICRALVTGLGGEISVQSRPGQGSTFTVLLPLGPPANP